MVSEFEKAASKILLYRFDPVIDSYMDIFADKSLTKEATKEGINNLIGLRTMLVFFTFLGAVIDCDVFDKGLNDLLKNIDSKLIAFRNEYTGNGDIDALISSLQGVIKYATEQPIQYVDKEHSKTTARNKQAKGFGWNSNYWGGRN